MQHPAQTMQRRRWHRRSGFTSKLDVMSALTLRDSNRWLTTSSKVWKKRTCTRALLTTCYETR